LGGDRGTGTVVNMDAIALGDLLDAVAIATQSQDHTPGFASLVNTHQVCSTSRGNNGGRL
jgi:hypothetical protein